MDIRFDPVEETEAPEDLNALPRGFTRGEFQSRVTNIVHKLIPETRGQPLRVTPYPDQRACPKVRTRVPTHVVLVSAAMPHDCVPRSAAVLVDGCFGDA